MFQATLERLGLLARKGIESRLQTLMEAAGALERAAFQQVREIIELRF